MPGWLNNAPVLIADALFASPVGVLYFHRFCVMESLIGLVLLVLQLVLFGLMDYTKYSGAHWLWIMMVSVPIVGTVARARSTVKVQRRCEQIMGSFQYRSVIEDLEALMQSRASLRVRKLSACLCAWCFLCIVWLLLLPPCGDLASNPEAQFEFTLQVSAEKGPCVIFECSSTLLLFTNGCIACGCLAVLEVLRRFPRNFTPPMGGAMPPELLERLPTCEVGAEGGESGQEGRWTGVSCSICLQDFQTGDCLRVLPCGHGFHKACADQWLQRASSCPMRCEGNLREALSAAAPPPPEAVGRRAP